MSKLESIEHYTGVIRGRLVDIERNAGDQQEKVKELKAERDELKRQVKVWERLAVKVEQEGWEHAERQATTVPRVITADELESWQCVAVGHNGHWRIIETGDHIEEMDRAGILDHFSIYPGDTIVLLEDAPAEEPGPVKVGDEISGVELLQKLPYGTILRAPEGDALERKPQGWWPTGTEEPMSSWVIIDYAPFAVLYLPEE